MELSHYFLCVRYFVTFIIFHTAELKLIMSFLSVVIGFTVVIFFFFLCSPASYRLNGLNQKR